MLVTLLAVSLLAQDPARVTSPLSDPLAVSTAVLKWDQAAPSIEAVKTYRFTLYGDGQVLFDLVNAVCGPPTGQTPSALFSCEVAYPAIPVGVKAIQVQAWQPVTPLSSPQAVRVVR